MSRTLLTALSSLAFVQGVSADYFKSYNADSQATAPDPTSALGGSWTTVNAATAANVAKGPGSDGGRNFWNVNDTNQNINNNNAAQNNSVIYTVQNTGAGADANIQSALQSADGWKLSVTLRVNSSANTATTPPAYNVPTFLDVRTRRIYDLAFVNDGSNEGIYHVSGGTTFTADSTTLVAALDLNEFHTIEMVMVPNPADHTQDQVSVYIDGSTSSAFTFTDSNTGSSALFRVQWGSGITSATQNVDWENVTFQSPVPEPTSLALVAAMSSPLLCGRRRRHRHHSARFLIA